MAHENGPMDDGASTVVNLTLLTAPPFARRTASLRLHFIALAHLLDRSFCPSLVLIGLDRMTCAARQFSVKMKVMLREEPPAELLPRLHQMP